MSDRIYPDEYKQFKYFKVGKSNIYEHTNLNFVSNLMLKTTGCALTHSIGQNKKDFARYGLESSCFTSERRISTY